MKFNLKLEPQAKEASIFYAQLLASDATIEIKRLYPRRTINQNSYLHLILGAFGVHFGYTLEEAKQIYKEINKEVYQYSKENRGKTRVFMRSSADLNKDEMAKTIDKFIKVSGEAGCGLPLATDKEWLMRIENELERNRRYL
jgi:hypothetical protein